MAVLSAETLQLSFLWTGSVDWPLPAVGAGGKGDGEVLAWMQGGTAQGWVVQQRSVERARQRVFRTDPCEEWGEVLGFERAAESDYVLVQRGGVRVYTDGGHSFVLRKSVEMEGGEGAEVAGYEVFAERGVVFVWAGNGSGCVVQRGQEGLWGRSGTFMRPGSVAEGEKSVVMAFTEQEEGSWAVAAFSQATLERGEGSAQGGGLAVGVFSLKDGGGSDIKWSDNKEVLFTPPPPEDAPPPCTSSTTFANMLVFAHGPTLHLHTLSTFLLSYTTPTKTIPLPTTSRICLLKRVKIGEYIAPGRHAGVHGGKEYLLAGTTSGTLFIIESPSLHPSRRLPLSATPIASATLLPTTLGKRLRSTLFVSSADGTASIVDVERARIMATFPSHHYLHLTSFAAKAAQNVLLLTYEDCVRREWDLGEEEGGVLRPPPPSSRGTGSDRNGGGGVYPADLADEGWHEVRVGSFEGGEVEEGEEENEGPVGGEAAMRACLRFCEEGLPTMVVDVKSVLDTLGAAVHVARQRSRRHERVVVGNNPALITAKALLTAVIPGGVEELLGWGRQDDYEWRTSVEGYFFRRKTPAVLGQIGAGKHISLLAPEAFTRSGDAVWGIGGTVTSIVLLAALALVGGLLEAGGKEEFFETVIGRAMENLNQGTAKKAPALGVFAKYWMDRNLLVRKTARTLMQICMQSLTNEQRDDAVTYWSRFLPVLVPPELFSSKDVVRSVVILGKLTADYPDKIEARTHSVKKNVALSVELLLGDSNPHFQDTAIELVGDGWSVFQSLFDPAEVIHILIRISSTPPDTFPESRRKTVHDCILSIARSNSPLLGSGLANNIAHGTPSPTPPAATTTSTAATTCVAAMRIAIVVVRADAILFRDILPLLVAATVKILDPSSPLREKVLPTVTELVNELIEAYPSIAFHRPTQRLALSAAPGTILIFDLKAATEMNVLQGHGSLANFLAFSVDGRYLAAVDLDEGVVLVWRFVSGLLSFIGGSDGPPGVLVPRRKEALRNARRVGVVEIAWGHAQQLQRLPQNVARSQLFE
ncbi:hypothetical protein P167DRAFT_559993 [Morchella conica CCBAS932]|uniref:WD40 repeat-like protein n=1 Tax=Morchella conica CCBAS932 TaxID=1392247 RepID=A0A3N4KGS7_9PEZI|nr:hypothetical protein P167DRAFT_559993 [Morchella conica CCBAS932]